MTLISISDIFKQIKKNQKINYKDKYKNHFKIKNSYINTDEGKKNCLDFNI